MTMPLAVLTPQVGLRSETFIRRHLRDLLPGGTIGIAAYSNQDANWNAENPVLYLDQRVRPGWLARRVLRRVWHGNGRYGDEARVVRFLRQHRTEVLLGEYLDFCLRWIRPVRIAGVRFFAHAHGYDISTRLRDPTYRSRYLETLPEATGIITMSRASRQRLTELGLSGDKIHVVPYGTDVPDAPPSHPPRPRVRCLAVGRMVAKKAPVLMLDAFRRAAEQIPRLTLDVVGTGELFPAALHYVRAFGLEQRVALHGGTGHDTVRQLMRESDLFLQHSVVDPMTGDEEGLPVAILEAMAHGLPVVSTRHAGIPEAVEEGRTGFLVEEGDALAMGQCIVRLAQDRDMRYCFGLEGWKRCRELFSWERERTDLLRVMGLNA